MLDFLNKKSKIAILGITLLGFGSLVAKGLYDYSTYKILKNIEQKFKRNTWDYYE